MKKPGGKERRQREERRRRRKGSCPTANQKETLIKSKIGVKMEGNLPIRPTYMLAMAYLGLERWDKEEGWDECGAWRLRGNHG